MQFKTDNVSYPPSILLTSNLLEDYTIKVIKMILGESVLSMLSIYCVSERENKYCTNIVLNLRKMTSLATFKKDT